MPYKHFSFVFFDKHDTNRQVLLLGHTTRIPPRGLLPRIQSSQRLQWALGGAHENPPFGESSPQLQASVPHLNGVGKEGGVLPEDAKRGEESHKRNKKKFQLSFPVKVHRDSFVPYVIVQSHC